MKANTIPDLYLEQALLDELPDDKKDRLEREDSADALENLRSSNRDILERYDPEEMARKIQLRLVPSAPNYYADGQIKEEVYVYGSFLQSKMYTAGVNCLDCHDKHSMKLKIEGNGLCLQCHSNEIYNTKDHHQHDENSSGAQCVNCHMASNLYMGVDDRRDHSFKIPKPDISEQFNTPNACIKCHEKQTNQWADDNFKVWYGKPVALLKSKQYLMALNAGKPITLSQHWSIIDDEKVDVISRASALQMLSYSTQLLSAKNLSKYLTHKEALLRLSAATVGALLTPNERVRILSPLLNDKLKAIRVAAARSLVSSHASKVNQSIFSRAFNELIAANNVNSWRGEGRVSQALLALEENNSLGAEHSLKATIKIEPYFETGYINLADLYRSQKRSVLVASVLKKGMKNIPKSGAIHYSFGLHLVRNQQLSKALTYFEKSMNLEPDNVQYAYTYILALDGLGNGQQALAELKTIIVRYLDKNQLKRLGLNLSQKLQSKNDYDWFIKK